MSDIAAAPAAAASGASAIKLPGLGDIGAFAKRGTHILSAQKQPADERGERVNSTNPVWHGQAERMPAGGEREECTDDNQARSVNARQPVSSLASRLGQEEERHQRQHEDANEFKGIAPQRFHRAAPRFGPKVGNANARQTGDGGDDPEDT